MLRIEREVSRHIRDTPGLRLLGVEQSKHFKFRIGVPDGTVRVLGVSTSPKNLDHAILNAINDVNKLLEKHPMKVTQ